MRASTQNAHASRDFLSFYKERRVARVARATHPSSATNKGRRRRRDLFFFSRRRGAFEKNCKRRWATKVVALPPLEPARKRASCKRWMRMRRPVVLNCLRVRRRPWVRYNRGAFVLSSTLVESKIIVFELHGVKTDVWWWSSWTKVVFFVGKEEDIFLIPLFQRTIFSSSSSRIKIFSNHAARTPLPSPPKKEQYYAMIDGKEGAKENARKKRFFLRFRAAVSRWIVERFSKTSSTIIFFTHKKNETLFKKL